jgi:hypothetical protein
LVLRTSGGRASRAVMVMNAGMLSSHFLMVV